MANDLATMNIIQTQKDIDLSTAEPHPLNAEGVALAEHKRFTFDIVDIPTDPLR